VKINTDTGFCPATGRASIGIIARGHAGEVILSAWKTIRECASAEEAEACLEGIKLAIEWIRLLIWMESDCATLVRTLQNGGQERAEWADYLPALSTM
jgi:hypothetical protein